NAADKLKGQPRSQDFLQRQRRRLATCQIEERPSVDLEAVREQTPQQGAEQRVIRAIVLAKHGRHAEATAMAEKVCELTPKHYLKWYGVACCYGLCVPALASGKSLDALPREDQETRARYLAHSLEALNEAIRHGFWDLVQLETDGDLAAIRQEAGFRAVVENLKQLRNPQKKIAENGASQTKKRSEDPGVETVAQPVSKFGSSDREKSEDHR